MHLIEGLVAACIANQILRAGPCIIDAIRPERFSPGRAHPNLVGCAVGAKVTRQAERISNDAVGRIPEHIAGWQPVIVLLVVQVICECQLPQIG
ncbi:hypothetical protein SDC9_209511 [bioreactor metagenome]|uniref:Uncharacterized protein n=1 Tax=bioreactor metagenome TaxID=1076179 RepID=A0A645JGG9_9ZZZZ